MKKAKIKKHKAKVRRPRRESKRTARQEVDLFGDPIKGVYFEPRYVPETPPVGWGKYSPYGD